MIKTISIILSIMLGSTIQHSSFKLVKSIPATTSLITTDNLGNVYIIKNDNLEKYDAEGNFLKNFSTKTRSKISFIDAYDPLKIMLFYKPFQQILFLDNMLSGDYNLISLEPLGYNQITLACTSHNNGFWIYNPQNSELIRFDQQIQMNQQTGNITQLTGRKLNPDFITEHNNMVYMNDSASGILVFDIYGTYSRTIPIKGLSRFQVSNNQILYLKENKLKSFNLTTLEEQEIGLPSNEVLDARTEKEKLYLLKPKSVDIYSVIK